MVVVAACGRSNVLSERVCWCSSARVLLLAVVHAATEKLANPVLAAACCRFHTFRPCGVALNQQQTGGCSDDTSIDAFDAARWRWLVAALWHGLV